MADNFEKDCQLALVKIAKIRKMPGGKYRVLSKKGKNLGTYKSRDAAKKRLKQVEYFKYLDSLHADDKEVIDLTKAEEFSYSAIMRALRQKASKEQVKDFLKIFKMQFDKAVKAKMHKPEKIALQNTVVRFSKMYKLKLDKALVKNAAVAELGNAEQVGKYLSDIVRFTLGRVRPEKRQLAIDNLKSKLYNLDAGELASKQLPESSAIGQSITFVKHVLFNHDANYVRQVLNSLVRYL